MSNQDTSTSEVNGGEQKQTPKFELTTSRGFPSWLASIKSSITFTTYQAGKIFFIGTNPATGRLSIFERTLERVMGLAVKDNDLYTSTLYQLWKFQNALQPGQSFGQKKGDPGYDRVFLPRQSWVTGDIDIHDMAIEDSGRLVFINTLFNCIATTSETHSFQPIWKPEWISKLAPEDRCHMNGLALRDGKVRYITSVSRSDVSDGWRDRRQESGVIVDIETNEVVCEGLAMPHSPRWHSGNLYVLNSGTGYFGRVDFEKKEFVPMTFLPGYARGLSIIGKYAVVGLSDRRQNRTFQDLPLEEELKKHDAETRCGLQVIDLETGHSPEWVRINGFVSELYDVTVLPGAIRPMAIGFKGDEVRRMISHGEMV